MTELFLSYPKNANFFLVHIYEQLLAMELLHHGYHWEVGNLGSGYIYVKLKQDIAVSELLSVIGIPDLSAEAIENAYQIVRLETEKNLGEKPIQELINYQLPLIRQVYIHIGDLPDMMQIQGVRADILGSAITILQNDQIVHQANCSAIKHIKPQGITPPFILDLPARVGRSFITYHTSAQSYIDGLCIELLAKTVNQPYWTILDSNQTLWLTFGVISSETEKFMQQFQNITANKVCHGPIMSEGNPQSQSCQIRSRLEWGQPISKLDIQRMGSSTFYCGYLLQESMLVLDYLK